MENQRVERFVGAYASDLAFGDGDRIADNYDVPALLVMTPGQPGIAVTDRAELAKRFSKASSLYREHGFGDPVGTISRTEAVTDTVVLAWVNWDYRDTGGQPIYDADYVYALRDDGDRLLIASVFSINEPERLAAWLASRSGA